LPIVELAPPTRTRRVLPLAPGEAPRPRHAVWELTSACDQRCVHCGPRSGARRADELTTEECLRLVDELAAAGVGEVTLIGGEAYLRSDLLLIVRKIREHGMTPTLTTGGYNLTRELADGLVEAGIRSVSVSIDGLEACHDALRGRPHSFQRAFAALRHLRAAGSQIACNSQINARTMEELPALLELLAPEGIHAWQVQLTLAHGVAADHPEILLQPYQMIEMYAVLERLVDRCAALDIRLYPGNSVGYFGPLEARLRYVAARARALHRLPGGRRDSGHREPRQAQGLPEPRRARERRRQLRVSTGSRRRGSGRRSWPTTAAAGSTCCGGCARAVTTRRCVWAAARR
jgi:MoaA/NifB/PqqE/SkfB family radical SAM enzyme